MTFAPGPVPEGMGVFHVTENGRYRLYDCDRMRAHLKASASEGSMWSPFAARMLKELEGAISEAQHQQEKAA